MTNQLKLGICFLILALATSQRDPQRFQSDNAFGNNQTQAVSKKFSSDVPISQNQSFQTLPFNEIQQEQLEKSVSLDAAPDLDLLHPIMSTSDPEKRPKMRFLQQEELSFETSCQPFHVSADTTTYTFSTYAQTAPLITGNSEYFIITWMGQTNVYSTPTQSYLQIYSSSSFGTSLSAEHVNIDGNGWTYSTSNQKTPSVNIESGNVVVTWSGPASQLTYSSASQIWVEVLNLQGGMTSSNYLLTSTSTFTSSSSYSQVTPRIASLGSISMIVWYGYTSTTSSYYGIYGALVNSDSGALIGSIFEVSTDMNSISFSSQNQVSPSLIALTQTYKFVILWSGGSSLNSKVQIYAQVYDPNTESVSVETFQVSSDQNGITFSGYFQQKPVGFEFGDQFGIAWYGKTSLSTTATQIYAVIYSESTMTISVPAFRVSADTSSYTFTGYNQANPYGISVGSLYVIAWNGLYTVSTNKEAIFAKVMNVENTVVPTTLVSADANFIKFSGYKQGQPAITAISDASFIVTWQGEANTSTSLTQIFALGYKLNGYSCVVNSECPSAYDSKCNLDTFDCNPCSTNSDCDAQGSGYSCIEGVCVGPNPSIAIPGAVTSVSVAVGALASQVGKPGTTSAIVRPIYLNMFIFLKFLNIPYPEAMLAFFDHSDAVSLEIDLVEFPSNWETESDEYEAPTRYSQYDIHGLFLENCWPLILSFCLAACMTLGAALISKHRNATKNIVFIVIIDTIKDLFVWNFILAYFIESGFDLSFFFIIQLQSIYFTNSNSVMIGSLVFSIIIILISLYIWIFVIFPKTVERKRVHQHLEAKNLPEKSKQFRVLHEEFKTDNEYKVLFNVIFAIRYVLYNISVTLPYTIPLLQVLMLITLNVGTLAYLLAFWPSRILRKNLETMFYEAALCFINIMVLAMEILGDAGNNATIILGDAIMIIYDIIFVVCMVFTIIELVTGAKELYENRLETIRELRHSRTRVHPESPKGDEPQILVIDETPTSVPKAMNQRHLRITPELPQMNDDSYSSRMILTRERAGSSQK